MNRLSREAQERLDDIYDDLRIEAVDGAKAEKTLGLPRSRSTETSIKRAA